MHCAWFGPTLVARKSCTDEQRISKAGERPLPSEAILLEETGKDERKTVVKTFRLAESLALSLQKEAANEGTTVNADVNSIIREHFEWHKKAGEFGFSTIPKQLLKSLLEGLDDETVARIGREVIPTLWKEMSEFWYQDSSPEGILKFQTTRSKFNPSHRTRITQEEGGYTIVFHHDLGPKWSALLDSGVRELVKQSFNVEPRISSGESVVTARFKVPPRRPANLNSPI